MGNPYEQATSHGEGIAYILKTAITQHWQDSFEVEMMLALCIPVVSQSPHLCTYWEAKARSSSLRAYVTLGSR